MGLPPNVPQETAIQYFGASMRELGEYGAGKGVEIWMEVHGNGTQNPPVAAALLRAAGHDNVGACWNSNPTDVQNGSVKESFALLRPWIRNVHLHELTDDKLPVPRTVRAAARVRIQPVHACRSRGKQRDGTLHAQVQGAVDRDETAVLRLNRQTGYGFCQFRSFFAFPR